MSRCAFVARGLQQKVSMSSIALPTHAAPSTDKPAVHTAHEGESTSLAFVAVIFGAVLATYGIALFLLH